MGLFAIILLAAALSAGAAWVLLRSRHRAGGELQRRVLDQTPDSVLVTDREGSIVYVNAAFQRVSGYASQDALGQTPRLLKSERHLTEFYQRLWNTVKGGKPFRAEFINRGKSGELYEEDIIITPLRDRRGTVTHYLAAGRDITERRQLESKLEALGNYDSLTGLLSQRLLRERATQAFALGRRHGYTVALLHVDLDGFRGLNDAFGRGAGDEVLRRVAERLKETLRESDAISRLGADDFAVLLSEVADEESIARVVRRIRQALASPMEIEGHTLRLQSSVGTALYPQDAAEFDELVAHAETALDRARSDDSGFEFFRKEVSAFTRDRLQLEEDLTHAADTNEFMLHYQPIREAVTGQMVGAEALTRGQAVGLEAFARWPHVRRGMILPSEFIPLAEQTGRIIALDRWALESAIKQAVRWTEGGWAGWISVNMSARSLHDPQLADYVQKTLFHNGLNPARLVLEITESAAVRDVALTARVLRRLKEIGVRVAVDDFGIGHSSLAYLKHFPVDLLKLDHSFVRDIGSGTKDEELIEVMITLAHRIGAEIVAEGVEETRQLDWLRAAGCDLIQGYLIGRPVPPEEVRP